MEQAISISIHGWLGLCNSTTNVCLYFTSSHCSLPIKKMSPISKSSKVSGQLLIYVNSPALSRCQSHFIQFTCQTNDAQYHIYVISQAAP